MTKRKFKPNYINKLWKKLKHKVFIWRHSDDYNLLKHSNIKMSKVRKLINMLRKQGKKKEKASRKIFKIILNHCIGIK